MFTRALFAHAVRPYPLLEGRLSPFDQMGFRFTRGQDMFTMQEHTHFYGLHAIAQNISVPSRLMEFGTMADFEGELREGGYDLLGLSANIFNLDTISEMCRVARRVAPRVRIVVGGYATRCLSTQAKGLLRPGHEVDELCVTDGIRYMRELVGDEPGAPVSCRLPMCGSGLPWLNQNLPGNSGTVLSGLGCTTACPFCSTSAQYLGRYLEVLDARGIFEAMKRYWRTARGCNFVALMDENVLNQRDKFLELGRLIREDTEYGLAHLNFLMFASANHVSSFSPEELLLNGVDGIWIGVESRFTALEKRQNLDLPALFANLHRHGLNTVGSAIVGFDYQTPENIQEDTDFYCSLSPTLQQIAILNVLAPTAEWQEMHRQNRLVNTDNFPEHNIYGQTFVHRNFTHVELRERVERIYRQSYEQNGPSVLRFLQVSLDGYEFCRASKNPLLSNDKARLFARRIELYAPLAAAVAEFGPTEPVRNRARELSARYEALFSPDPRAMERVRGFLLKRAAAERERFDREGLRLREEPFRVYDYPGTGGVKPYDVHFLQPRGSEPFFRAPAQDSPIPG